MKYNNSSMLRGLSSASLGADMNSGPIRIREAIGFCVQLVWTGASVDGEFKIQVSNDSGDSENVTNWEDLLLPVTSVVTASGADSHTWNVANLMASWFRIVFTRTSGTGTITVATFTVKGY